MMEAVLAVGAVVALLVDLALLVLGIWAMLTVIKLRALLEKSDQTNRNLQQVITELRVFNRKLSE
jgi:hypothetical protein